MSESIKTSILIISTVHFFALILLVGFSLFIYLKANKNGLLYSFLSVQSSFLIWILAKILKSISPVVELRWFFVVFQYFGICTLELTFLQFAYYYTKGKSLPKTFFNIAIPVVLVQFFIIATNESHHLFYATFDFYNDTFGPAFYGYIAIMYSSILVGIVIVGKKFKKEFYRQKAFYEMSIAMVLPLITNIFYLSGYYHLLMKQLGWYTFDITPLGFELSLIIFSIAIYKKDFLSIMPIYVEEIINQVTIGVVIFDHKGHMLDCNKLASQYFDEGLSINDVQALMENSSRITQLNDTYLEIFFKVIIDPKKRVIGNMITVVDVTPYIILKGGLEEQIKELEEVTDELETQIRLSDDLSLVSSKNFVARELHDILGHSMTLTIKLLEVALIECTELKCSNDEEYRLKKAMLLEKLMEAQDICSKGYNDLRISLMEKQHKTFDIINLKTEINKIANVLKFAGIEFELSLSQVSGLFSESEYLVIKRFCQECITNSVKHGKASYIHIQMEFNHTINHIIIHDNGVGCNELIKGNGLKGIEDRIKTIDGQLSWSSSAMNGFDIKLSYI